MKAEIVFLLTVVTTVIARPQIVNLLGAEILADQLDPPVSGLTSPECQRKCAVALPYCIGIEYTLDGTCTTLTNIRNLLPKNASCSYWIMDARGDQMVTDDFLATLNETDQLVYFNAYPNFSLCPQSFVYDGIQCTAVMENTTCSEYAAFFDAFYDGTQCIIELNQRQMFCNANPEKSLLTTSSGGYCYFALATSTTPSMATFVQQCQTVSAKSYPAAICSHAENDFVATLATSWPAFFSMYFPPTSTAFGVYTWSNTTLTSCTYRNWGITNSTTYEESDEPKRYSTAVESIVGMEDDEEWYDFSESVTTTAGTLICRENALTMAEYSATCESIDNCKQIIYSSNSFCDDCRNV